MRFLLDHDVPDDIVFSLAALGHEAIRLRELVSTTTSDEHVLQLAYERDSVLMLSSVPANRIECQQTPWVSRVEMPHNGPSARLVSNRGTSAEDPIW